MHIQLNSYLIKISLWTCHLFQDLLIFHDLTSFSFSLFPFALNFYPILFIPIIKQTTIKTYCPAISKVFNFNVLLIL